MRTYLLLVFFLMLVLTPSISIAAPLAHQKWCPPELLLNSNFPVGDVSNSAEIKHAVAITDFGHLIAYLYTRADSQEFLMDGRITGAPVPEQARENLAKALRITLDGKRSRGELYRVDATALSKAVLAGFSLYSCY